MKCSPLSCLAVLAGTALATPMSSRAITSVTAAQLQDFRLFAQYSAAGFCNHVNAPGQPITCARDHCPLVEANDVTTSSTFSGKTTDIRGVIALDHTKSLIVVSVRGSVSIRNWITDLIFAQAPCDLVPSCRVHTGFLVAWKEIAPAVLAGVKSASASFPAYKIAITGHSLGGAVATLGAGYLRRAGHTVDLYTYGSPRVGNAAFTAHVTAQPGSEFRITHQADPVPRLPPLIFNYRHTSPEFWLASPDATPADVTVCEGDANLKCNGGTTGLNMDFHGTYFRPINGCGVENGSTPWRRSVSDAELEAKIEGWAKADKAFAAGLFV